MDAPFPRRHRGARVEMHSSTEKERSARMKITTIGVDLAKSLLQVHGVDEHGKGVLRKQLERKDVLSFFANLEPCLVGMEACGSAHYWARKLAQLGHTVRLMAPQFVKPYVKTNKSDRNDRRNLCTSQAMPLGCIDESPESTLEARFVPISIHPN